MKKVIITLSVLVSVILFACNTSKKVEKVEEKKPIFVFTFDDGCLTDSNVVKKFNEYGFKCGFGLITKSFNRDRISEYLDYQQQGFDIMSHSVSHAFFNSEKAISLEEAEIELKSSLDSLTAWGFDIKGFVTPYSKMQDQYLPILKKYYQFGYTSFYKFPRIPSLGYQTYEDDLHLLKRLSLEEENTDSLIVAEIDECIAQKGILHFYAHVFPQRLTEDRMDMILSKLKALSDEGKIEVLPPNDAADKVIKLRNSQQ